MRSVLIQRELSTVLTHPNKLANQLVVDHGRAIAWSLLSPLTETVGLTRFQATPYVEKHACRKHVHLRAS